MKVQKLIYIIVFLIAVVACRKNDGIQPLTTEVVFSLGKTKAAEELPVDNVTLLVFRENGDLESSVRCSNRVINLTVSANIPLEWYCVANAPESLILVSSLVQFNAAVSHLEDNTVDSMVMMARGSKTFSVGSESVEVSLSRLLSRIRIKDFEDRYLDGGFMDNDIRLERVWVLNAPSERHYTLLSENPLARSNYHGLDASLSPQCRAMLVREYGRPITSARETLDCSLYCFPDNTAGNTSLIVELSVDGIPDYFPIPMPSMKCNTEYIMDLILMGPGSSDPNLPVDRSNIEMTVQIRPWENESHEINFL